MAVVGRVARPHGIRGQLVVNPETDFPEERFALGATLFMQRDGSVRPIVVTAFRLQQGRPVIGLDGIHDMDAARSLAGLEFRVPVTELTDLPEGTFYHHDLIGCVVETDGGAAVGMVSAVEGQAGSTRLVVQGERGETLIPLATDICTSIDPRAKRIVIAPPPGLIELNERRKRES